ncbi:hypothetical protein [Escherichia phage vB_EcoM-LTH01]
MARPTTPIVVFAAQDVNLPGTGRPNKSKPIDDLLAKGYDKGQKPAAEEFNYILHQSGAWLNWIVEEKFPEVEEEYKRLIQELETRVNNQLEVIREDVANVRQSVATLRTYVEQTVADLRREITAVDQRVTRLSQDLDNAVSRLNARIDELEPRLVPIGAILTWAGQVPPAGFLECNGQVFSTSQNPRLYQVLGRNVVPDYRGLFLRGWAHGSGAYDPDSGRALGSIQGDAIRNITGVMGYESIRTDHGYREQGALYTQYNSNSGPDHDRKNPAGDVRFDASRVVPTAPENRPKNVAVMYIIKTDQAQGTGSLSPTALVTTPDSITNRVGFTQGISAQVLPANLASQYPVTWTSQNGNVATVDSAGNVRLTGPGETNIIASISTGISAQVKIVSYTPLTAISIGSIPSVEVNDSEVIPVNRTPANSNEPLVYSTSNANVAVVTQSGYVSGVAPGTAVITVRGSITGIQATRQVTVIPAVVVQTIEDVRLGIEQQTTMNGDNYTSPVRAPAGCVITGVVSAGLGLNQGYYKPIQKRMSGVWVTVEG